MAAVAMVAVPEVDTATAPVAMAVAVVDTPEVEVDTAVANQAVATVVTAAEVDPPVATNQDLKEVVVQVVPVAPRLKTALSSLETLGST